MKTRKPGKATAASKTSFPSVSAPRLREPAAATRARYADFVKRVRKDAAAILDKENVPGGFRLFQRRTAMHGKDGWSKAFFGKYSSRSFWWTGSPNISINPEYIHAYCKARNTGIDPDWDDAADPLRIAVDTVIHEFGHGIWDLLREDDPGLYRKAHAEFSGDEEEFAEEFLQYLRGSFVYADFFLGFLDEYRKTYARLAEECEGRTA